MQFFVGQYLMAFPGTPVGHAFENRSAMQRQPLMLPPSIGLQHERFARVASNLPLPAIRNF